MNQKNKKFEEPKNGLVRERERERERALACSKRSGFRF